MWQKETFSLVKVYVRGSKKAQNFKDFTIKRLLKKQKYGCTRIATLAIRVILILIQRPKIRIEKKDPENTLKVWASTPTSEVRGDIGSNPSVLVGKTKSTEDGLKTAHTDSGTNKESRVDDISKKIKLEDLSEFLKDMRSVFFTPDSPQDESIIVTDESEEEDDENKETHDTSHDMPEDTLVPPPASSKLA
nr:hypothetical protein [Tanacetum cinerariifolium]